jgi:hypothetical protein
MDGPIDVRITGYQMLGSMVIHQCNCGRLYSGSLGYFSFAQGEGVRNVRKLAPCNSHCEEQMYLAEVLDDERVKLKCTTCDYERIVARKLPAHV